MYQHIMVPADDSVLPSLHAETAVQLARKLGSRVTFFHAPADLGATRSGAKQKAADPHAFEESAFGGTHMVLAELADRVQANIAAQERSLRPLAPECIADDHWASMVSVFLAHHFPGFGALPDHNLAIPLRAVASLDDIK